MGRVDVGGVVGSTKLGPPSRIPALYSILEPDEIESSPLDLLYCIPSCDAYTDFVIFAALASTSSGHISHVPSCDAYTTLTS